MKKNRGKNMATKKTSYDNKLEYNNTYNRNNYRSFSMRLNNEKEKDIIQWLESQDSLKDYLLTLIEKDMEKSKKKQNKKDKKKKNK